MAMEPLGWEEKGTKKQTGESGAMLKTHYGQFSTKTHDSENLHASTVADRLETLTCNALALLMDGMVRRARCIHRTTQLLRFVIGCRLYELNR